MCSFGRKTGMGCCTANACGGQRGVKGRVPSRTDGVIEDPLAASSPPNCHLDLFHKPLKSIHHFAGSQIG
jgi:hypothetical protein